jgi:hypothetical protein
MSSSLDSCYFPVRSIARPSDHPTASIQSSNLALIEEYPPHLLLYDHIQDVYYIVSDDQSSLHTSGNIHLHPVRTSETHDSTVEKNIKQVKSLSLVTLNQLIERLESLSSSEVSDQSALYDRLLSHIGLYSTALHDGLQQNKFNYFTDLINKGKINKSPLIQSIIQLESAEDNKFIIKRQKFNIKEEGKIQENSIEKEEKMVPITNYKGNSINSAIVHEASVTNSFPLPSSSHSIPSSVPFSSCSSDYEIPSNPAFVGFNESLETFFISEIDRRAKENGGVGITEEVLFQYNRPYEKEQSQSEEENEEQEKASRETSERSAVQVPPLRDPPFAHPTSAELERDDPFGSSYRTAVCSEARQQLLSIINHCDSSISSHIRWLGFQPHEQTNEKVNPIPPIPHRLSSSHPVLSQNRISRDIALFELSDFSPKFVSEFRSIRSEFLGERFLSSQLEKGKSHSVEDLLRSAHLADCLVIRQAEVAKFLLTDDFESLPEKKKKRLKSDEKPSPARNHPKTNELSVLRIWQCGIKRMNIINQVSSTLKILEKAKTAKENPTNLLVNVPTTNPHSLFLPNLNFVSQTHPICQSHSKSAQVLDAAVRSLLLPKAGEISWEELFAVHRPDFHPLSSWPVEGFSPLYSQIYLKFGLCLTLLHDELSWSSAVNYMKEKSLGVAVWIAFNWFEAEEKGFTRLDLRHMLERGDISEFLKELIRRGVNLQGVLQHPGQILYSPSSSGSVHLVITSGIYCEQVAWNSTFTTDGIRHSTAWFNQFPPVAFNCSLSNWFTLPLFYLQLCHGMDLGLERRIKFLLEYLYNTIQEHQAKRQSGSLSQLQIEFFHHNRAPSPCITCRRVNIHMLINFQCIFCYGIFTSSYQFHSQANENQDQTQTAEKKKKKRKKPKTNWETAFWSAFCSNTSIPRSRSSQ